MEKTKTKRKIRLLPLICAIMTVMTLTISVSASGSAGTASSAISAIGTALTGIMGYIAGVTSEMLGNDAWLLGMGFFVLLFIAGFVSYWFRIGRR